jgi:2'-5' RNA ligase
VTRTFIAIELSDVARELLARKITRLARALPAVRWVDPSGLHLTLAFLGELDDAQLSAASEGARLAAATSAHFTLATGDLGSFGPPYAPRVIWVGIRGDVSALSTVHERLAHALEERGFPREARPFSPHLTLARLKAPPDAAALARLTAQLQARDRHSAPIPVRHLSVMKSELARSGARYTCLEECNLR